FVIVRRPPTPSPSPYTTLFRSYLCVWLVARSVLAAWPSLDGAGDLGRFGWTAVWTAVGSILLYFAALMSTHIAAFRTARNIRRADRKSTRLNSSHVSNSYTVFC